MPLGDEEPIGFGNRETAKHDRVEQREHGRRPTNAERQRRDCDSRKDRTSPQQPKPEANVLKRVREHGKHRAQCSATHVPRNPPRNERKPA